MRGRDILDISGEELGEVDDLLIDDAERKVRFLEVTSGSFIGLSAKKFRSPIDAIVRITADAAYVNQTRERVATVPAYHPTLTNEPYLNDLYHY